MRVVLPWRRGLFLFGFFLFSLITLFPLRLVVDGAAEAGLAARAAVGTAWLGELQDARLAGLRLGDVRTELAVLPLLTGEARLSLTGSTLRGTLIAGRRKGVRGATGQLTGAGLPSLQAVDLQNVTLLFNDGRCATAEGQVRATPDAALSALGVGTLEGQPRCDGPDLRLPLVSASGRERVNLRLAGDGYYEATLTVQPTAPEAAVALTAAGFAPGPTGLVLTRRGAL